MSVELDDASYDTFRELEGKLSKPPGKRTNTIVRKKKYTSPYRQEKVLHREVTCSKCKLPSRKGLPPFVAITRFLDGERVRILAHAQCPGNATEILEVLAGR